MPSPIRSMQSIDASFDLLITNLEKSFPNADICERLAFNRLRHALARQRELEASTPEIHPSASPDVETRRAHRAADRDFWRALTYLQRRLDHRARLAERQTNPTPAYAETLFQPDAQSEPATPRPPTNKIVPANTALTSTPSTVARTTARAAVLDLLAAENPSPARPLPLSIAPANTALASTFTAPHDA